MNSTMPIKPVTEEIGTRRVQIPPKPAYRTRMCHELLEGFCSYGDTCRYAHGAEQLREAPRAPNYKTVPCRSYSATGVCSYGRKCQFLHKKAVTVKSPMKDSYSTASSSPSTVGSYEYNAYPALNKKTAPCHSYSARGFCKYGNKCRYTHERTDFFSESVKNSDPTTSSPSSSTVGPYEYTASSADNMYDGYSSSTDSAACSINLDFLDQESRCSSPEPMPTDEPWPISYLDRLLLTQAPSLDTSSLSVDERYPSSLIALRPIYDEWQRIQNEPWGKPKKSADFNPFFY